MLEIATLAGDHLIQEAITANTGVGWRNPSSKQLLTGFSHGVSGIAWALTQLGNLSGQKKYLDIALKAIDYERTMYSSDHDNWLDLRQPAGKTSPVSRGKTADKFMVAWCHGAPGIGLSRLQMISQLDNQAIGEIRNAVATTLTQGFSANHSLCHGSLGNTEILLQASHKLNDRDIHIKLIQTIEKILTSIDQEGLVCGVPLGIETPGLMLGISGMGYQLLRLSEPELVPSLLTLEPPNQTRNKGQLQ